MRVYNQGMDFRRGPHSEGAEGEGNKEGQGNNFLSQAAVQKVPK